MPIVAISVCYGQFISGDMERGPLPAIGGLDFNQAFAPVTLKAENVIPSTIAILNCGPSDLVSQVLSPLGAKTSLFMMQHEFFTGFAERPVASIPLSYIELSGHFGHKLCVDRGWLIRKCGGWSDPK